MVELGNMRCITVNKSWRLWNGNIILTFIVVLKNFIRFDQGLKANTMLNLRSIVEQVLNDQTTNFVNCIFGTSE